MVGSYHVIISYHRFFLSCDSHDTIPRKSRPNTSQENGVADGKHRYILDTTWALLISANVPQPFWGKVTLSAVYILTTNLHMSVLIAHFLIIILNFDRLCLFCNS